MSGLRKLLISGLPLVALLLGLVSPLVAGVAAATEAMDCCPLAALTANQGCVMPKAAAGSNAGSLRAEIPALCCLEPAPPATPTSAVILVAPGLAADPEFGAVSTSADRARDTTVARQLLAHADRAQRRDSAQRFAVGWSTLLSTFLI